MKKGITAQEQEEEEEDEEFMYQNGLQNDPSLLQLAWHCAEDG